MSKKAGEGISKMLSSIGIKAPWKWTGPVSSSEFITHVPASGVYRKHSPLNQPGPRVYIPQAEDDKIYDIAYFKRDTIRKHLNLTGGGEVKLYRGAVATSEIPSLSEPPLTPAFGGLKMLNRVPVAESAAASNNGYTA